MEVEPFLVQRIFAADRGKGLDSRAVSFEL